MVSKTAQVKGISYTSQENSVSYLHILQWISLFRKRTRERKIKYEGYIYRVDSTLKDGCISWRCTNKKCKGRLRTNSAQTVIVPVQPEHNHESTTRMRRKSSNNNCVIPRKLDRERIEYSKSQ